MLNETGDTIIEFATSSEIGTYNPLVEPSEFKVDVEKTKKWIANGAQPTDTVKALLKKNNII